MSNSTSSSSSTTSLHERNLLPAPTAYTTPNPSDAGFKTSMFELENRKEGLESASSEMTRQTTRFHAENNSDQGTTPNRQTTFPQNLRGSPAHFSDSDDERYPIRPVRETGALGRRMPLPSFGYDDESDHPTTPTPPERIVQSTPSSAAFSPSSTSSRKQYASFFDSGAVDSPRTQRVKYGIEPSATPAIGTDPMHALRLSLSHGSGFYMPEEEQARITGVGQDSSTSTSFPHEESFNDNDNDASRWYDPNDDSGYNASFGRLKRKERIRQGSKALDSDSDDDNEHDDPRYPHTRLQNIHAPAPTNILRHFGSFDIEHYDTPKTPSASDSIFHTIAILANQSSNNENTRLDSMMRTLEQLTDKVNNLSYEQASQHREIQRQNREIDRQGSEIDRLRHFTYQLSRSSDAPSAAPSNRVPTDQDNESRRPSLAVSLTSGMSVAQSHGHDRADSYHYSSTDAEHSSRDQSGELATSMHGPYGLHRSASQHIMGSSAKQEIDTSHARALHQSLSNTHQAQQQFSAQHPHLQSMHHTCERTPPVPSINNANGQPVQTNNHAQSHPSMPPRYASAVELYPSLRSRASTTSAYTPSGSGPPSAASTHQTPFYALATASGVVLSDHDSQRGGQPNYRQLLQDQAVVDYRSIVRLILDRNDQQASIFLQQKLKSCMDPPRRSFIIDSILPLTFELITNRFGNFIVSRCLDLGDERQRTIIANTMQGHISTIACDTYGSHVVQKAIDLVEGFDLVVVAELGRNAKTLVNKSSGHVWSKLLSASTPVANLYQSLKSIKEWSQIAMDETGSLLCQAILENWPIAEKENIVNGLIKDTLELCSSQWSTFVVLHLIEHGREEDRDQIFELLLRSSITISQDPYGAKAIEKMIKVAGLTSTVVQSYVKQICDANHGRPAVVSICQNANGSQIVTLLLTNAPPELKEMLIEAIRRHGVTLKGSKHGSRLWYVVERARAWRGH